MNLWVENIFRFIIVVALQLLLVDHLQFLGLCHPYVYVLFLLALPQKMPRWIELMIGFAIGLMMDMFACTLGVHTAACTAVAYFRPLLIRKIVNENDRLIGSPTGRVIGQVNYLKFVSILIVLHHIILFSLAAFSWHCWWITLAQIAISSIVSIGIIAGIDLLKN